MIHGEFQQPGSITDLEEGAVFAPKFSADGLIACVVSDHATGRVVMVAHMNEEALARTIASRKATYWSRSRQALWVKGETSGHSQYVERMQVDCDQDVILLSVTTAGSGANCHTGRISCFYRDVDLSGDGTAPKLVTTDDTRHFNPTEIYKTD
uniref:phosphoribosyl-AMP cyclohydrolase n=1 Tax=Pararhizobium sp. IMCC3301 TaxID=3067904 RepID=UPI002740783C|nr:phosphoribosyl-AMP cyclohydrolase [Pararhizobium sp. IMCC3301]